MQSNLAELEDIYLFYLLCVVTKHVRDVLDFSTKIYLCRVDRSRTCKIVPRLCSFGPRSYLAPNIFQKTLDLDGYLVENSVENSVEILVENLF